MKPKSLLSLIVVFALLAVGLETKSHGQGIEFRNVSTASATTGLESLLDGRTLAGWNGNPELWRVEEGCITGETTAEKTTKENSFLIWQGKLDDFELRLKFRIEGGNSGVQYRSKDLGEFRVGGYQAEDRKSVV